ncbi:MAG: nucleotide pyrophosphohydrolase [Saprospiraceae bacterium]
MEIKEVQDKVDVWVKQYGVRYFDVMTNTAILMEEVGELARLNARIYGEQSFKSATTAEDAKKMLADEMADILFVLTCLANQSGIDLEEALRLNFEKKSSRDKDRHHNNPKLSDNIQEID